MALTRFYRKVCTDVTWADINYPDKLRAHQGEPAKITVVSLKPLFPLRLLVVKPGYQGVPIVPARTWNTHPIPSFAKNQLHRDGHSHPQVTGSPKPSSNNLYIQKDLVFHGLRGIIEELLQWLRLSTALRF